MVDEGIGEAKEWGWDEKNAHGPPHEVTAQYCNYRVLRVCPFSHLALHEHNNDASP